VEEVRKRNVVVAEKEFHNVECKIRIWAKDCRLVQLR
jgi:hypothetical protein